jgi:hypothetical protein
MYAQPCNANVATTSCTNSNIDCVALGLINTLGVGIDSTRPSRCRVTSNGIVAIESAINDTQDKTAEDANTFCSLMISPE